jgi:hypothetical protein
LPKANQFGAGLLLPKPVGASHCSSCEQITLWPVM